MRLIYYIPNIFLLKYGLYKISSLRPILEVAELSPLTLIIVVFVCHFDDDLVKGKNPILVQQSVQRIS